MPGDLCANPPRESCDSQGRVGKTFRPSSIKTLVTQMTRNNGAFSIHVTVSPPPRCHVPPTCAAAPLAFAIRRPMRLARWSPSEIVVPSRLIGPLWLRILSWAWRRMKRENVIMAGGGRVAGRCGEIAFAASKCQMLLLGPLWCHTGLWDGFGVATVQTQKQDGDRLAQTHTCKRRHAHTHTWSLTYGESPKKS